MLHSSFIIWNAKRLNWSPAKERRLCFVNTSDDSTPTTEAELALLMKQLIANEDPEIENKRNGVTNDLKNLFGGSKLDQDKGKVNKTPYQSSSDALKESTDALERSSEIILLYEQDEKVKQLFPKSYFEDLVKQLEDYETILKLQNDWLSAKYSPQEYEVAINKAEGEINDTGSNDWKLCKAFAKESLQHIVPALVNKNGDVVEWARLTPEEKLVALNTCNNKVPGLSAYLSDIGDRAAEVKNQCKGILEDIYKEGRNADIFGEATETILTDMRKLWGRIEWTNALEMWKGTKLWWQAVKRSFDQYSDQRASKFASKLSKVSAIIPMREFKDADEILKEDVKKKKDGIRSNYVEYYKADGPSYLNIFDNGGLWDNANDDIRRMALLLYAAEKGWLYGIASGDIHTKIAGKARAIDLTGGDEKGAEALLQDMQSANASGFKKEEEGAYNRVRGLDSQNKLQKELHNAIYSVNLPAVVGIAKRCNEKGLDGRANERTLVAVLEAIHDPTVGLLLRQAIDEEWLDNMGKLNAGDATIGIGHLKPDRAHFYKYIKNYDTMGGRKGQYNAGVTGRVYAVARQKILDLDPSLKDDKLKLEEMISDLLSSRDVIIKKDGKDHVLSIWHRDFRFYRDSRGIAEFDAQNHKPETDWDYSDQESSQVLRSQKVYDRMLAVNSEGSLDKDYGDQAKAFLKKIVKTRDRKLEQVLKGQISKDEYLEFMRHASGNMGGWVGSQMKSYLKVKFAEIKDPANPSKLLMQTLLEKNLLSPKVIIEAVLGPERPDVALTFLDKFKMNLLGFAAKYELSDYLESRVQEIERQRPDKGKKIRTQYMSGTGLQVKTETAETPGLELPEDLDY